MPDPWRCAVLKDRRGGLSPLPVAMARGKHLFPFRTEQLSPSAPMVLGSQGPGRVGRRRFFLAHGPPTWRPVALVNQLAGGASQPVGGRRFSGRREDRGADR